jgi:hypothetical protein
VARTDESKPARRILERAVAALGGKARLSRTRALYWRARGTFHGLDGPVGFTGEWWVQHPGKMKVFLQLDSDSSSSCVTILDGGRGWITGTDFLRELSSEEITLAKEELYQHEVTALLPLRDDAFRLDAVAETKIADQPAAGVRVMHAGHCDLTLFIDCQSDLLVKSSRMYHDPVAQKDVSQETFYSDYSNFGSRVYPRNITMRRDDKDFVNLTVLELTASEKPEGELFAWPTE